MNAVDILLKAIAKVKVYRISPINSEAAIPLAEIKKIIDEAVTERPDPVRRGSVYVPDASYLDKKTMSDPTYDKKTVSWEVIEGEL